jgi:hypothetical protein
VSVRKIYLMSPREPSGATWLINCLLELGIKTYRNSSSEMWVRHGQHYRLAPHEEILKKWLPALWDHPSITFRNDVEVEWSHVWPSSNHDDFQVIFFTRDPRDSLFSRYKREASDQTFEEFVRFPDVNTLLDKAHNWRLFNFSWMAHPNHKVFRFEDYKKNDAEVLSRVLEFIGLEYSQKDIVHALAASTFARAAEAEVKYRAAHPEDQELINRSGKAGEWRQGGIPANVVNYIETVCADAMRTQGYVCMDHITPVAADYSGLANTLPFMQKTQLPEWSRLHQKGDDLAAAALEVARTIDREKLKRAGLRAYEVVRLLDSLALMARASNLTPLTNYRSLYRKFGAQTGLIGKIRYHSGTFARKLLRLSDKASRVEGQSVV